MSVAPRSSTLPTLEPPTTFGGIVRQLGPGLIIAGSIVGSGELIATTKTGAQVGYTLLWLILIGCVIKVFVQIELGRYTISSGDTCLEGLNRVPGPRWRANWIVWFWLLMFTAGLGQLGAIVGGVGQALAISLPITGDYREAVEHADDVMARRYHFWLHPSAYYAHPVGSVTGVAIRAERLGHEAREHSRVLATVDAHIGSCEHCAAVLAALDEDWNADIAELVADAPTWDDKYWAIGIGLVTIVILVSGRYGAIQAISTALVATFTVITVGNVVSLQFDAEWHLRGDELLRGISFAIPEGDGLATALATFGIIGVGASELVAYPYWCLEKGYARYTGPRSEDARWAASARGWMRVMRYDAWFSMVVYTTATMAFYVLGASILHREALDPGGSRMVPYLSEAYVPVFGEYARWLFLFGAFAVLYSTYFVASAGHARVLTDALCVLGLFHRDNVLVRRRSIRAFSAVIPAIAVVAFVFIGKEPDQLVLFSGMMQAIMLPMLGFGALYLLYGRTDRRIQPGTLWRVFLVISCLGLLVAGVYSGWQNLNKYLPGLFSGG